MFIRPAEPEDCDNLASLSLLVWLSTYAVDGIKQTYSDFALSTFTRRNFVELLSNKSTKLLVYAMQDRLLGYAQVNLGSHYQTPEHGFEIERLYVHPKFKGQGIGRQLLVEIGKRFGQHYWLYTWVENEANAFYQHLGFTRIDIFTFALAADNIENNVWVYKTQPAL